MTTFRLPAIAAGFFVTVLMTGCGDTYRPVVNPIPGPSGNPKIQLIAVIANEGVNSSGAVCAASENCNGSVSVIDVPGDINVNNQVVGEDPTSVVIVSGTGFTANGGANTVSTFAPLFPSSLPTTSTLPKPLVVNGSNVDLAPMNFVSTAQSAQVFATIPAADAAARGVMAVFSTGNGFSQALPVGVNPVSLVQLPDGSKVYVVNRGDATLSTFAITDFAALRTIPVESQPVLAIPRPDSKFLFVLNRGAGSVSVVNTSTDTVALTAAFSTTGSSIPNQPIGHPMVYDAAKTRLWVTSPADNTVTVFDTSSLDAGSMPIVTKVQLPANSSPFAVAVLPDGSRAYVVTRGGTGVDPAVYFIDAVNFTSGVVPGGYRGRGPRDIVTNSTSTDNSTNQYKVYVINHDPTFATDGVTITQQPGTNIISSVTNAFILDNSKAPLTIPAPFQDPTNCTLDGPNCPRQRPNAVVAQ